MIQSFPKVGADLSKQYNVSGGVLNTNCMLFIRRGRFRRGPLALPDRNLHGLVRCRYIAGHREANWYERSLIDLLVCGAEHSRDRRARRF